MYIVNALLPKNVAVTLVVHKSNEESESDDTEIDSITDLRPNSNNIKTLKPKVKRQNANVTVDWKKKTRLKKIQEKMKKLFETYPHLTLLEPAELFPLFLSGEICELIREETERYPGQNNRTFSVSQLEIKKFLL